MKEKFYTLVARMEETALHLFTENGAETPYSNYCTGTRCGAYFRLHQR